MDAKVNFQNVVDQAVEAGRIGANEQLAKLTKAGPAWVVKNGSTPIGMMLDVCGFAHIRFYDGRNKNVQGLKKWFDANENHGRMVKAYYGKGFELYLHGMSMRQEMSVNEEANSAAANKFAELLKTPVGIESRMD